MIRRLLFRRNGQPLVIGIERVAHDVLLQDCVGEPPPFQINYQAALRMRTSRSILMCLDQGDSQLIHVPGQQLLQFRRLRNTGDLL